ncbi:MAG: hypothetical protein ONA90_11640, partial [candidate division KSB1 bacterium]|nr:hypothetical protein [candidate division KSB1 bacterium]
AGGTREEAVIVAQAVEPPIAPDTPAGQTDLIVDRFENLSQSVDSNFVPGQDNRKSAEEVTQAVGELGRPPAPPPPTP